MDRDRRPPAWPAGVFVVGSLTLLAAVILTLSSERGLWKRHYRLVTYFDNVQGLIPGAPIRLAGKDVGTVENVLFSELDAERPPVQVDLLVEQSVQAPHPRELAWPRSRPSGCWGTSTWRSPWGHGMPRCCREPRGRCLPRVRSTSMAW